MLTDRLADGLRNSGVQVPDARRARAAYSESGVSRRHAGGIGGAAGGGAGFAAPRLGRLRVSPHVYNDEADVDRFMVHLSRFAGEVEAR